MLHNVHSCRKIFLRYLGVFTVLGVLCSVRLQAYVDPGAGSYVFQILFAFFLGLLFWSKQILRALALLFGRSRKSKSEDQNNLGK